MPIFVPNSRFNRFLMMSARLKKVWKQVVSKSLIWLGFGATPFVFMACYGPVPTNYQEADFDEAVVDTPDVEVDTLTNVSL